MTNEEYFCVAIMTLFCQGCLWVSCAYPNEAFPFGTLCQFHSAAHDMLRNPDIWIVERRAAVFFALI